MRLHEFAAMMRNAALTALRRSDAGRCTSSGHFQPVTTDEKVDSKKKAARLHNMPGA